MDYTFAELLTREQLLIILKERRLILPNMDEMAYEELISIYKSFALPLARREIKGSTRIRPVSNDFRKQSSNEPNRKNYLEHITLTMEVDEPFHTQLPCVKSIRTKSALTEKITCEKRSHDYKQSNPLTDEFLSVATKRIKIAWT